MDKKVKKYLSWIDEAHTASRDWRSESWYDEELADGDISKLQAEVDAGKSGLKLVNVNRIFPTVNLITGTQSINKHNITAKGRTNKDGEISQVMTEAIQFVVDQNEGQYKISKAFRDEVVPGIGFMQVSFNSDPRQEKIKLENRDWKEMFWDPFADPWLDPTNCRYVFCHRWMDIDVLEQMFPDKKREINDVFLEFTDAEDHYSTGNDEATEVDEKKRLLSGSRWANKERRRVRPAEIWYPKYEKAIYAVFPDGRVIEVSDQIDELEQYNLIQSASEVVPAVVLKMKVAAILGETLLMPETNSPFQHDLYPFIPFVGYTDRFKTPYGVPRQIRGQNEEVIKRRSTALAMLASRRVTAEADVGTPDELQKLYEESQRLDSFMVIPKGKMGGFIVEENSSLAGPQMQMGDHSEREIQEISGANAESLGYGSNVQSGVGIGKKQAQGAVLTASLYDNLRRSLHMIGVQVIAGVQQTWTAPKILRVTDSITGAQKFHELNQQVVNPNTGEVMVKNDITQGKYDLIVSDAPQTDTVREQNLQLIIEWVKKSPPEVIPKLMAMAFEMSNLPNKDALMAKIKPLLGEDPLAEDKTPDQLKEEILQQLEAQKQASIKQEQLANEETNLKFENMELVNDKIRAEIKKIIAEAGRAAVIAESQENKDQLEGFKTGIDLQEKMNGARGPA